MRQRHRHLPLNTWSHHTPASLTWGASWDQAYHTPPMDYKPNGLGRLLERRQEARSAQRRLLGRRLALPRAMGAPIESCVCRRSQSALPSHFFGCDDDGARESLRACWAIPTDTVLSCTTMTFLSKPTFLWSKPTLSLAHNYFLVKTYFISLVNSYFLSDAGDA